MIRLQIHFPGVSIARVEGPNVVVPSQGWMLTNMGRTFQVTKVTWHVQSATTLSADQHITIETEGCE